MQSPTLERYFAMVQFQRESLYRRIENLPPEAIWKRPASRRESGGTWSVGQNLEHVNRLLRLFRWLYTAYLPIAVPIARAFFVGKPFSVEAEDIFQRDTPRPPASCPATDRSAPDHTPNCGRGWTASGSERGKSSKTFPRRWPATSASGTP